MKNVYRFLTLDFRFLLLIVGALGFIGGCESQTGPSATSGTDWGAPFQDSLLEPFQGEWTFHNRPETEQDSAKSFHVSGGPDLRIDGHIITEQTPMGSEFRLFELHEHDGRVCGKAWFHEDPHDPGDMSKVFVTLAIDNNTLTLRIHHPTHSVDINDPDLKHANPVISKTPSLCPVAAVDDSDSEGWDVVNYIRAN
jgi:hypothetical protein